MVGLPFQVQADLIATGRALVEGLVGRAEVAAHAGQIQDLPAGGGQAIGLIIVLAFLLWRFSAGSDAKEPAKK